MFKSNCSRTNWMTFIILLIILYPRIFTLCLPFLCSLSHMCYTFSLLLFLSSIHSILYSIFNMFPTFSTPHHESVVPPLVLELWTHYLVWYIKMFSLEYNSTFGFLYNTFVYLHSSILLKLSNVLTASLVITNTC